ncbi:inverted formin-2 [Anaeramoeba flamelloides]|uniref:Inverted formin-2 n=1 Tax=Anaeramoeba flamelloides TaxID=1746091 RepID=A0ABQ8YA66_9EUKA|nr:inverted formin-2 [Anaeramoeba flamelloides]
MSALKKTQKQERKLKTRRLKIKNKQAKIARKRLKKDKNYSLDLIDYENLPELPDNEEINKNFEQFLYNNSIIIKPKTYIEYLNQGITIQKLISLKVSLRSRQLEFFNTFLQLNGDEYLIDMLSDLVSPKNSFPKPTYVFQIVETMLIIMNNQILNNIMKNKKIKERIVLRVDMLSQGLSKILQQFPKRIDKKLDKQIDILFQQLQEEIRYIKKKKRIKGLIDFSNYDRMMLSIICQTSEPKTVTRVTQLLLYFLYNSKYTQDEIFQVLNDLLNHAINLSKKGNLMDFKDVSVWGNKKIKLENKISKAKVIKTNSLYSETKIRNLEEEIEKTHPGIIKEIHLKEEQFLKQLFEIESKKERLIQNSEYIEQNFQENIQKRQKENNLSDIWISKTVNNLSETIVERISTLKEKVNGDIQAKYQKKYIKGNKKRIDKVEEIYKQEHNKFSKIEKEISINVQSLKTKLEEVQLKKSKLMEEKNVKELPKELNITFEQALELKKKREEGKEKEKEKEKGKENENENEKKNDDKVTKKNGEEIPPPPNMGGGTGIPPPPNMGGVTGIPPPPNLGGSKSMSGGIPPPPILGGGAGLPPPPNLVGGGIGGGLPPPPNLGKGGIGQSQQAQGKKNIKPKVPLKPIHWAKIPIKKKDSTIWKDIDDEKIEIDLKKFSMYFGSKKKEVKKASSQPRESQKKQLVQIIDANKSRNLELLLPTYHMSYKDIVNAILSLDETALSESQLKTLLVNLPEESDFTSLKSYEGDVNLLHESEKFCLELLAVNHLRQRIKSFIFYHDFKEIITECEPNIKLYLKALNSLKTNKKFHKILQFILKFGNYLNGGTNRGGLSGFKLRTLLKLKETNSTLNPKISLLHYIMAYLEKNQPKLIDFYKEMQVCVSASKCSYEQIQQQIRFLNNGIKQIETQLPKHEMPVNQFDRYKKEMQSFLREAKQRVDKLTNLAEKIDPQYQECVKLFGDNPDSMMHKDFFSLIATFLKDIETSLEDNHKRVEEQKKKKKKKTALNKINKFTKNTKDRRHHKDQKLNILPKVPKRDLKSNNIAKQKIETNPRKLKPTRNKYNDRGKVNTNKNLARKQSRTHHREEAEIKKDKSKKSLSKRRHHRKNNSVSLKNKIDGNVNTKTRTKIDIKEKNKIAKRETNKKNNKTNPHTISKSTSLTKGQTKTKESRIVQHSNKKKSPKARSVTNPNKISSPKLKVKSSTTTKKQTRKKKDTSNKNRFEKDNSKKSLSKRRHHRKNNSVSIKNKIDGNVNTKTRTKLDIKEKNKSVKMEPNTKDRTQTKKKDNGKIEKKKKREHLSKSKNEKEKKSKSKSQPESNKKKKSGKVGNNNKSREEMKKRDAESKLKPKSKIKNKGGGKQIGHVSKSKKEKEKKTIKSKPELNIDKKNVNLKNKAERNQKEINQKDNKSKSQNTKKETSDDENKSKSEKRNDKKSLKEMKTKKKIVEQEKGKLERNKKEINQKDNKTKSQTTKKETSDEGNKSKKLKAKPELNIDKKNVNLKNKVERNQKEINQKDNKSKSQNTKKETSDEENKSKKLKSKLELKKDQEQTIKSENIKSESIKETQTESKQQLQIKEDSINLNTISQNEKIKNQGNKLQPQKTPDTNVKRVIQIKTNTQLDQTIKNSTGPIDFRSFLKKTNIVQTNENNLDKKSQTKTFDFRKNLRNTSISIDQIEEKISTKQNQPNQIDFRSRLKKIDSQYKK